jgi:nucleoside-diphosphate-sugar epimerase
LRALVTGAAGFVGSTLCERLIRDGYEVVGVDSFTPYYDPSIKHDNLQRVRLDDRFTMVEGDLMTCDVAQLLTGIDVVFHQAGQPGVRLSWAEGFSTYVDLNIKVTQRLLEAARTTTLSRFVYASSSSVYGNALRYPVLETDLPRPQSPYGVTKLAAEHLAVLYARNYGVPTTSLRYFTVYGPRQRPDMATQRLVEAAVEGRSFPLFGDGSQLRDFTYVDDIVEANVLAATADTAPGEVLNLSGGSSVSMSELIRVVEETVGRPVDVRREGDQAGDVTRTGGDSSKAARLLSWQPVVSLTEGVRRHVAYHSERVALAD